MIAMAEVELVRQTVTVAHLKALASALFGDLVKAVVDVDRGIMAIGGELHADEEAALLDDGASQANLWGINLYPAEFGQTGWLEFDSMINVRPSQGNRTRSVDDPEIRRRISDVVDRLAVE
jgi:hypothetical protein